DADVAGWLLLLYPFSLYLYGAVYSDALFLALVLGAFWCLEKGRSGWAAVLGALATATRPLAPAVVLGLTVRQIERARLEGRPLRFRDAVPLLASVGFLAYCAFLYAKFGDPLAFAHVQGAPGWDQAPGWHSWLKVTWFERVLDPATSLRGQARLWIHALTACGALALVIPTGRRLGWGYAVYCAVAVGIPFVSSKDFMGMGRYVLSSFPLFLTGASVLEGRPRLRVTWLVVSGTGLAGLAYAFGADVYVS
ncbi:MAG TPA: hypothetical protein VEY30_03740, partial [Myxococcaceae bacterium]|nr:hypothetical protein [Myxococcaceae bacterium]